MDRNKTTPICDYEGSSYQETFWEAGGREYEDQAEAVALAALLPSAGDLLLEIGAGAGRNTPRYQGFKRVVLLDYSVSQLRLAQERLGKTGRYVYVAADAYRLPFVSGLFDAGTMIRVLHHMTDGPAVLSEIRRVLLPGGIFILEYANKRNLKAIVRFLAGRQSWSPFAPEPIEFAELNFNFHPETTAGWLRASGFRVQAHRTVSHFRTRLLKRWIPLKWLVAADAALQKSGRWVQFSPSVFVRSQAVGKSPAAAPSQFFRCPACRQARIEERSDQLTCQHCGAQWQVEDGIYIFKDRNQESGKG